MKKILITLSLFSVFGSAQASNQGNFWEIKTQNKKVELVPAGRAGSLVENKKYVQLLSSSSSKKVCVPSEKDVLQVIKKDMEEDMCHSLVKTELSMNIIEYTCKYEDAFNSEILLKPIDSGFVGIIKNTFISNEQIKNVSNSIMITKTKESCETN